MYQHYLKRILDCILSFFAIILLFWMLMILTIIGTIVLRGNPFFVQRRPGRKDKNGKEKIFNLVKFRTMSNEKDKDGNLLPDKDRLNKYGKFLRATSMDELPELFNILVGDMAFIGPRPQLVRDMVFMTEEQRHRHDVRPGLSGLAQVNGRNSITWEKKIEYDLIYINRDISLSGDFALVMQTLKKIFSIEDIVQEETNCDVDLGDWLLIREKISKEEYEEKLKQAKRLMYG